jgi:hypothetical protein
VTLRAAPIAAMARLFVGTMAFLLGVGRPARAQALLPADVPSLRARGDSLLKAGRFNPARAIFDRLVAASPNDPRLWLALGDAELGLGDRESGIRALRQAYVVGVRDPANVAYRLGTLFGPIGPTDSAIAWLDRAMDQRYENRPAIGSDSSFASIARDPRFRRIAQVSDSPPGSRDDGWRGDLAVLVEESKRLATGPDPVALTPEFDAAAAALRERIPQLANEEMYVELQRLTVLLGNGHSLLYPLSTPVVKLTMLPVDLYQFTDGLYVIGGIGAGADLIGSKVERIGQLSAPEALDRVVPVVTRDNPMGLLWNAGFFVLFPAVAHHLGIETSPDSIHLELRDSTGAARRVALAGGEFRPPAKLRAPAASHVPAPLYLKHPDDPYWLERLPTARAVYVQFNQVMNKPGLTLADFADSVLRVATRSRAGNLIVDVRRNNGGNGYLNWPLNRTLIRFEGLNPQNRIYIITGRNTFSAAQTFITVAERTSSAVFVGEPSSSRPNFVGEDTPLRLPYSGIIGSISSRFFQGSDALDNRQWIAPDIPVQLSSRDYFGNQDPVLDAVLASIRKPLPRRLMTSVP